LCLSEQSCDNQSNQWHGHHHSSGSSSKEAFGSGAFVAVPARQGLQILDHAGHLLVHHVLHLSSVTAACQLRVAGIESLKHVATLPLDDVRLAIWGNIRD